MRKYANSRNNFKYLRQHENVTCHKDRIIQRIVNIETSQFTALDFLPEYVEILTQFIRKFALWIVIM